MLSARRPAIRTTPPPRRLYFLVYRARLDSWPELGRTKPVGGLVVPLKDANSVEDITAQRYHKVRYERYWWEEVTTDPEGRKLALRLHRRWERDMQAWLEEVR